MEQYGKNFKQLTFKEKLEYIKEYYLWYIVSTIIGVTVLSSIFISAFTPKEVFEVNALVAGGINYDHTEPEVDTYYKENFNTDLNLSILDWKNMGELENAMIQKIAVMIQTRELDILAVPKSAFEMYASQEGVLTPLDEIPELAGLLKEYEDRLVTWDKKFTDELVLADVEEQVYGIEVSNFPNIPCITIDDDFIITVTGVVDNMPNTIDTLKHLLEGSK